MSTDFKEILEAESIGFPNTLDVENKKKQRSPSLEIYLCVAAERMRSQVQVKSEKSYYIQNILIAHVLG